MRIAHVVTFVSSDGAFGGPLTVAMGQAKELARRGHDVDLIAGWDGIAEIELPGVTTRFFPTHRLLRTGFSGIVSPALQTHVRRALHSYDVLHVHMSRDLVTIPAARLALLRSKKVVLQTHGMIMPDRRPQARLMDSLLVRATLSRSDVVLCLTDAETAGVESVSRGGARTRRIANGIEPNFASTDGASIVGAPDVLFLARLHPRKRVMVFAEVAKILSNENSGARFSVVGPDEGDLAHLKRFVSENGLDEKLAYEGALPPGAAFERLKRSAVYVLPSFGEVFPMTILEALSAGTPVVLTDDCGIAPELKRRNAALVTDGSPSAVARAVTSILNDREVGRELIRNGHRAVEEYFSIRAVVDGLEALYR